MLTFINIIYINFIIFINYIIKNNINNKNIFFSFLN